MRYQQIKWLILIIPTIVVGLWEYVRHEFLLSYLSMDAGNILTPVIVFLVTITLLLRLFVIYEKMQEELKKERAEKAVLKERERIARELHDGIAQTLFLCSVQLDHLKQKYDDGELNQVHKHLRQIHDDVRQSIYNLKHSSTAASHVWQERLSHWLNQFRLDTGIPLEAELTLKEERLNPREKVELFACIQEALTNIRKHASAEHVTLRLEPLQSGWSLTVLDDGKGFTGDPFQHHDRFGLKIMQERARNMKASFSFTRENGITRLQIKRREDT
ncbi:sensor histidine kinase [Laceyella putida]|uniref:histidine kinase n=1 Tax=Laceyella putida TaxID=110101 RepID=A0ABW2RP95_9BACL